MDAKAEKIGLFRYGLIAPLVLEPVPRGELTRRAPLRHCRFETHVDFGRHVARLGAPVSARRRLRYRPGGPTGFRMRALRHG
jgi:hypothetical protein